MVWIQMRNLTLTNKHMSFVSFCYELELWFGFSAFATFCALVLNLQFALSSFIFVYT